MNIKMVYGPLGWGYCRRVKLGPFHTFWSKDWGWQEGKTRGKNLRKEGAEWVGETRRIKTHKRRNMQADEQTVGRIQERKRKDRVGGKRVNEGWSLIAASPPAPKVDRAVSKLATASSAQPALTGSVMCPAVSLGSVSLPLRNHQQSAGYESLTANSQRPHAITATASKYNPICIISK